MAGKTTNDILFRFLADTKSLERGTKRASKSMKKSESAFGSLTKAAGALGLALGAREVLKFAGDAVQLAAAADEAASKFEAVFEGSVKAAEAVETFGTKAGVTEQQANDLFGTAGNLAQAMGFTVEESAALTEEIGLLAADLASFNDADPAEVFNNLNKAVQTTEREGMKQYGISVSEVEVKQRALNIALADGRQEAGKQDRALASLQIANEQAGKAVGDLDRTYDSVANRQRRVEKSMKDLKVEIGRGLMPVFEELLGATEDFLDDIPEFVSGLGKIRDGFNEIVPVTDDAAGSILDYLRNWNALSIGVRAANENLIQPIVTLGKESELTEHDLRQLALAGGDLEDKFALTRNNAVIPLTGSLEEWRTELGEDALAARRLELQLEAINFDLDAFHADATTAAEAARNLRLALNPDDIGPGTGGGAPGVTRPQHAGGTVPGRGTQLVPLKGGETVSATHPGGRQRGGGGSGVTVNVNFSGVVGDPVAVAEQIQDLIELYGRTNGVF